MTFAFGGGIKRPRVAPLSRLSEWAREVWLKGRRGRFGDVATEHA